MCKCRTFFSCSSSSSLLIMYSLPLSLYCSRVSGMYQHISLLFIHKLQVQSLELPGPNASDVAVYCVQKMWHMGYIFSAIQTSLTRSWSTHQGFSFTSSIFELLQGVTVQNQRYWLRLKRLVQVSVAGLADAPGVSCECELCRVANEPSVHHCSVGWLAIWPDSGKLKEGRVFQLFIQLKRLEQSAAPWRCCRHNCLSDHRRKRSIWLNQH